MKAGIMKRTLRCGGLVAAVWAGVQVDGAAPNLPELLAKARPGICTLMSYDPAKAMPAIGTGFFTGPDTVATAHHLLAKANRAEVRTSHGQVLAVSGIVAEDRANDLIVVRLDGRATNISLLKISRAAPRQGEWLFALSNPLGFEGSASEGIVAALREVGEGGQAVQHTVPISPGSSGCPLLNQRGEVAALQTSTITAGQPNVSAGQALNFAMLAGRLTELKPRAEVTLEVFRREPAPAGAKSLNERINRLSYYPVTRDDFAGALPLFEEAARRRPQEPDVWFRLGLCKEKLGRNHEALEHYQRAAALNYQLPVLYNNLGAVCNRLGRFEEALRHLARAVELDPGQSSAHNSLAYAYNRLQRHREAADSAREAARLNPKDYDAIYNLGLALAKLNDKAGAREQEKRLRDLKPDLARQLSKEME